MFRSLLKVQPSITRAFATVRDVESCAKSFEEIIASRNSCKKYKNQDVSDDLINRILSETLTAPTARNWQPYKIVIMRDKKNLEKLSATMFGKNADIIKQVPGAAIFLADTDPFTTKDQYKELCIQAGQNMDDQKMNDMMKGMELTIGKGGFTGQLHKCGLKQESNKRIAPEYYTFREWTIKQTIFPMELFVLACQANGLSTNIMEGFDGRKINALINCSKRYFVTGVVPFGYADDTPVKPSTRYNPKDMVYKETFGNGYEGIETFKRRELNVCYKKQYDIIYILK